MRFRWSFLVVPLLALLLAAPAAAQQGSFTLEDDGCGLNRSTIESNAQRLTESGAQVVVVCTDDAGGDSASYLNTQLSRLGVARSTGPNDLPARAIVYYVAVAQRDSGIFAGRNWGALSSARLSEIRSNAMNPQLQSGDFTAAYVSAITDTAAAIGGRSPAPSGGGGGVTVVPVGTGLSGAWCVGLVALAILGVFVLPQFLRRRQQTQAASTALDQTRDRFNAARNMAGAAIADMGREMEDARLKQRFDEASYGRAEAEQLAQEQQAAERLFSRAQADFDAVEERLQLLKQPSQQDYEQATADYERVRDSVSAVRERIQQLDARRAQLDQANQAAPGEVDDIKKG